MLGGILPANTRISWELHVSGLFVGLVLAFVFRHVDRVPLKRYDWELEEDGDSDWSDHMWGGDGDDDWYDGPDESDGSNSSSNNNDSDNDNRRSEEHTSELQSRGHLVCRLLLEKKK